MQMFHATVEIDKRDAFGVDAMMDALASYHPAIGQSVRGFASATISLPAETLAQACTTAAAVVSAAFGGPAIAAVVMTEPEFLARQGWAPVPDLVSVSEAAQLLGISRQAVLQRIGSKSLPAEKVGRGYAIPRSALTPP